MLLVASGFDVPECLRAATEVETGLLRLTSSLTEAEFHAPPRTGGWSMGQCVEHLVLTGHAFLTRWDVALKHASRRGPDSSGSISYSWLQRQLLRAMEDAVRFPFRTSPALVPCARHSLAETVHRFQSMRHEMATRLAAAEEFDVRRTSVPSPLVSWMNHALGFSFDVALAHERRHLRQAWRVRRQLLGEAVEIVRYDT